MFSALEFSEMEIFLKEYHAKYPGCTPNAMASGLTEQGISSYDLLSTRIPKHSKDDLVVLDLACGDGFLLEKLDQRNQLNLSLL